VRAPRRPFRNSVTRSRVLHSSCAARSSSCNLEHRGRVPLRKTISTGNQLFTHQEYQCRNATRYETRVGFSVRGSFFLSIRRAFRRDLLTGSFSNAWIQPYSPEVPPQPLARICAQRVLSTQSKPKTKPCVDTSLASVLDPPRNLNIIYWHDSLLTGHPTRPQEKSKPV
jgi:hypothetical protein